MPDKANHQKKPSAKAAPAAPKTVRKATVKKAAPKNSTSKQAKASYYVGFSDIKLLISKQQPTEAQEICQCENFTAAQAAAIDVLVEAIENAELQLTQLKRAANYEQWRKDA